MEILVRLHIKSILFLSLSVYIFDPLILTWLDPNPDQLIPSEGLPGLFAMSSELYVVTRDGRVNRYLGDDSVPMWEDIGRGPEYHYPRLIVYQVAYHEMLTGAE